MSVPIDVLRQKIIADKALAMRVIGQAKAELNGFTIDSPISPDLHNTTGPAIHQVFQYRSQQHAALSAMGRGELYFARVESNVTYGSGSQERTQILITKSRVASGLSEDDWVVVAWTAPLTALLLDKPIGTVARYEAPRRSAVTHCIEEAARFGAILPTLTRTDYHLKEGRAFVEDESVLAELEPAAVPLPMIPPIQEYKASPDFGLGEIIELADVTQREAMHLPFGQTVLVEGPPGSGKTSIGLMRMPCLIDRQWEELGKSPDRDQPFHRVSSMRVLVMNEEMIEYLGLLTRDVSIALNGVSVQALGKFCRRICSNARTLSGREAGETPALTAMKLSRYAVPAYVAGFRGWTTEAWATEGQGFRGKLAEVSPTAAEQVGRVLSRWVEAVGRAHPTGMTWVNPPNLSTELRLLFDRMERELPIVGDLRPGAATWDRQAVAGQKSRREQAEMALRYVKQLVAEFCERFYDRRGIVGHMANSSEFAELLEKTVRKTVDRKALVAEWAGQTAGDIHVLSQGDLALTAWLSVHTAYVRPGQDKPPFGAVMDSITHVLIDEAQDVAPVHIGIIQRLLDDRGTMTLVGDLRQRVTHHGHFGSWHELGLEGLKHAAFTVNHRQSAQLGEYVRALHRVLYAELPVWNASKRPGPKPRLRRMRKRESLAQFVAEEIQYWRAHTPNATVAVLYHGKWPGARQLRKDVEARLQNSLTEVHLAVGKAKAEYLRKTDCAIIASVAGTKGLEFDAVVVVDPRRNWSQPIRRISEPRKNALYVACSRAKQCLSIVLPLRAAVVRSRELKSLSDVLDQRIGGTAAP